MGRSPIERKQHPNMTIDVDSDVKQHIQTINLYDRIPGSNNIFTLVSQMLGAGLESTWPERYHDATRQGTVKLDCIYAKWRWVHYLHGSLSSGELICLAQGQHGAASATVIDPMTSRFGFPCFTTTSPRSLFILCLLVCLNIGINHGFQSSNIRWITRKAFEHKAAGRVFKRLPSDPANV